MIASTARPLVVAALVKRLAQIGSVACIANRTATVADPEDALRRLMVRHFPRPAALADEQQRAVVCELLLALVEDARGGDWRFLDAFNTWFEKVDATDSWRSDGRWQIVRAAYAGLLQQAIEQLSGTAEVDADGTTRPAAHAGGQANVVPPAAAPSKALVLADHWIAAVRILNQLGTLPAITTHCLICNNGSSPTWAFAARQAAAIAATGPRGLLTFIGAVLRGRVHIKLEALHSDAVVGWLRAQSFCVGLHAMGVIYREPVLTAFRRGVLNAHIGLLPEYKGRSVMEWSVLAGAPTGVTVFFMDSGIDTGSEVVLRRAIDVSRTDGIAAAKASLFGRDGEMYRAALDTLRQALAGPRPSNEGGRRYYVMSGLLCAVVDEVLHAGARAAAWEAHACINTA